MTSAARSTRLRDSPCATPASVFIEHGTIAIPQQPWLPLAIVAPRSRLLCSVMLPAVDLRRRTSPTGTASAFRRRLVAELVAQQPAAVIGDDELDVNAAREQRRDGPRRVDRTAGAGDRDRDRAARISGP